MKHMPEVQYILGEDRQHEEFEAHPAEVISAEVTLRHSKTPGPSYMATSGNITGTQESVHL